MFDIPSGLSGYTFDLGAGLVVGPLQQTGGFNFGCKLMSSHISIGYKSVLLGGICIGFI